ARTRELAEVREDLAESLEQQTATSEVLHVISSSPGELENVFKTILANATRICEAEFGMLWLVDGAGFRSVALHVVPSALAEERRRSPLYLPSPTTALGRVAQTKHFVHIADVAAELAYHETPEARALVELGGCRSLITVPMLKEKILIGAIAIYRQEVRPFTDKQIELVQNFANQALIAIENARLLNELRQRTTDLGEALEQQTATSEVLGVISGSPGELQPVFDGMLAKATCLCEARFASLLLSEGDQFQRVSLHNAPPALVEHWRRTPIVRPHPESAVGCAALTKQVAHVVDIKKTRAYLEPDPLAVAGAELAGYRTVLAVPMLKEGKLIGVIVIYRQEVRPFTDKQIALVQNFAAQAVIAIENVRLLNELRQRTDDLSESLEQQTATSEVLRVISSSSGELAPVVDSLLASAKHLCGAAFGILLLPGGDAFRTVALHGATAEYSEARWRAPVIRPAPDTGLGRVLKTKQAGQIADVQTVAGYVDNPVQAPIVQLAGVRTKLTVPMLKEEDLIGAIEIDRQEVRPFTYKQIELVKNFAAQAVIAIESARLLSELRESLQQQTATADVLKVISRSTFDLQAVLSTLVESAVRLCEADTGHIARPSAQGFFHSQANYGFSAELREELE